jgi:DNA-binding NarL/FixJ family response regulator
MESHHARTPITVFVVEDHADVRERLVILLNETRRFRIVGEAETAPAAVEGILRTRPDSVVLDIHLTGGNGLQVLRTIRPLRPAIGFVVLTNHPNAQYRKAFAAAGADCLLDKTTEFSRLPEALFSAGARLKAQPGWSAQ